MSKITKNNNEWKERLTTQQYWITREKGTEPPFSGEYYHFDKDGKYLCVGCGNELFDSETKYDSGSGWPSFWAPITTEAIGTARDTSHGMVRIEVFCDRCGAHLGHLFEDGPRPTGQRYCINSLALRFEEQDNSEDENQELAR